MDAPPTGSLLALLGEGLAAHGSRLRALQARARSGGDEDLVHDARVALRRVEALARLFRGSPGKGDGEAVRASARALRRRLSLLRSEEVGRALLARRVESPGDGPMALVFPEDLPDVRVGAEDLRTVGRDLAAWKRRLSSALDGAFAPRAGAERLLRRRTRRRLRRRLAELAALLPPDRKTLHAARIAAKRARYALEAVEPLEPGARRPLRLLRSFQDAAGDAHDLLELAARVRAAGGASPVPDETLLRLARGLEAEAGRAVSAARRRGAALAAPVRGLRPALGGPESR